MAGRNRPDGHRMHRLSPVVAALALIAGTMAFSGSAAADVASVDGGAFGAGVSISLAGDVTVASEPRPSVALPTEGGRVEESNPAVEVGHGDESAPFGGRLLETGALTVRTEGTTGSSGEVASSASVSEVDALGSVVTAVELTSQCTSAEGGATAATVLLDASLVTSETETVALPAEPAPNTVVDGAVTASGDAVTVILNEQEVIGGRITVNAMRIVVEGPSAAGEIVLAQARCGATVAAPSPPAPTEPPLEPVLEPSVVPAAEVSVDPAPEPSVDPAAEVSASPGSTEVTEDPSLDSQAVGPEDARVGTSVVSTSEPKSSARANSLRGSSSAAENVSSGTGGPGDVFAAAVPTAGPAHAVAQVSQVSGGAFGYSAEVSLFGAQQPPSGPAPQVTLPAAGGDESADAPSAEARFGPAVLFESARLTVSTKGTTGAGGSVTSSASVLDVGPGPFTAGEVASTCTATESGANGSATITAGTLEGTSTGDVQVPQSPAPNTEYRGVVEGPNDEFRIVFNEQVVQGDAITVNAVHMYLLGPTAEGDLIIGQSRCGLSTAGPGGTGTTGGADVTGTTGGTDARTGGTGTTTRTGTGSTGRPSGQHGGRLADTGGEAPGLWAVALVLAGLTTRRWARPRPVAGPDDRL